MKKLYYILLLCWLYPLLAPAQTYPVAIHTRFQPPYSVYLSDYLNPEDERMAVTLTLRDAQEAVHDVRLRISIRGAGISLQSKADFPVPPITLQSGVPFTLKNTDFTAYLHPANFTYSGITHQEFVRTGRLPEGLYEISWQAYDYRRTEVSLSEKSSMMAWIILHTPPTIQRPLAGEKLKAQELQQPRFSWSPATVASSAQHTEYLLEIYEIRDTTRSPYEIIRSSNPLTSLATHTTSLTYGPAQPTLIPGLTYAFRIRAYDTRGRELYKNNGYSEVRTFTYGEACLLPQNIRVSHQSSQWVQLQWDASPTAAQFTIRYREHGDDKAAWFEDKSFATTSKIHHLKPGTTYEYHLQSRCGSFGSAYTPAAFFTTLAADTSEQAPAACRTVALPPPDLHTGTLLPHAQPGSIFRIGHFYMKVSEVHGSKGSFSGKGEIFVPFLSTTFQASFQQLQVNAESQVTGGQVTADFMDEGLLSAATVNRINSFGVRPAEICISYDEPDNSAEGYNSEGYDAHGYDREGYNSQGYKQEGYDRNGAQQQKQHAEVADEHTGEAVQQNHHANAQNTDTADDTLPVSSATYAEDKTSAGQQLSSGFSDHNLEKIIRKYLKQLRKQVRDSADDQKTQVEALSDKLHQAITEGKFDRKSVLGLSEDLTGEGVSQRISVGEAPVLPSADPAYHLRIVRKKLHDQDEKLQYSKYKLQLIEQYLDKPAALVEKVRKAMQELQEEVAENLQQSRQHSETWIHRQVDSLLDTETLQQGSAENSTPFPQAYATLQTFGISAIDPAVNRAYVLHQMIQDGNRRKGAYSMQEAMALPVGIARNIGNTEYLISIGALTFTPSAAYIDAYMSTEVPWTGDWLAFQARKVEIFPEGFGGRQNQLLLAEDVAVRMNNNVRLTIRGSEGKTSILWDCGGFREMAIQGDFEFCEGMLMPAQQGQETVKAHFETSFQEWGAFIAQISMQPFQIKGLKDFTFEIKRAYADFSDLYNPASMVFPRDYRSAYLEAGLPALWQGFFLQEATVKLPARLQSTQTGSSRKELSVENLIIDEQGVSGIFSSSGVIPEGSLHGWAYTVDKLSVHLLGNKVKTGELQGSISLPMMETEDTLGYRAVLSTSGQWLFNVQLRENLTIPLWQAKMQVLPSSYIEIKEEGDSFLPVAVLNGSVNIQAPVGNTSKFSLSGIQFEQLTLSSRKPYFSPGTWSLNEIGISDKAAGFALTLTGLEVFTEPQYRAGIAFHGLLSLMDEQISAAAHLRITGHLENSEQQIQRWYFDKASIGELSIHTDGQIGFKGSLTLFDGDPVYGEGFAGVVEASFLNSFTVGAKAQFGQVNGTRYWYVDANTRFQKAIPIAGSGLGLYGFGGGAYYHMRRQKAEQLPLAAAASLTQDIHSTPTGIRYIPDPDVHLGVKADAVIGTAEDPRPFHGNVGFEVSFNRGGGVSQAAFTGDGYFMRELETGSSLSPSSLYAGIDISYDFSNRVLHGNCKVYVNAAGGLLRGSNPGNLAGEAVLHFDPYDWYIHIGRPSSRLGLTISAPIRQFPVAIQASSYFMAGTRIDPMPAPPAKIRQMLSIPYEPQREDYALATGKGFAFGTDFSINTGKLQVAMFYGQLEAGTGLDLMLMNHSNKICAASGETPGINGWYAEGQAYAYLEGAIGIRITVFEVQVEEEILRLGAATLLQAALPNPFWLRGAVGGYYSLLGGRVSGKCHFDFEVGQACKLQPIGSPEAYNPMENLAVISELTPADRRQQVDVFTTPQAVFNLPVNQPFALSEKPTEQVRRFRIRLDHFTVKAGEQEVAGSYTWNERQDVLAFNPDEILPGNTEFIMEVQVSFEENRGGLWRAVEVNSRQVVEKMAFTFTTGEAPDHIPERNVLYSYPVNRQLYYLPGEHSQGYIQLAKGQQELFSTSAAWKQVVRLSTIGQTASREFDFTYQPAAKRVAMQLPADLKNEQVYLLELLQVSLQSAQGVDQNITEQTSTFSQGGQEIQIRTNKATGTRQQLQEKVLYSMYFRTSRHNTFSEKLAALEKVNDWQWAVQTGVQEIGRTVSGAETFDHFETEGTAHMAPLLSLLAGLNAPWHKTMDTLVYFHYAPYGNSFEPGWRKHLPQLGKPPVEAVMISQSHQAGMLSDDAIHSGQLPWQSGKAAYVYQLPYYMYYDYYFLQQAAANARKDTPAIRSILKRPFVPMYAGDYKVYIGYRLPGEKQARNLHYFYITKP